MEIKSSSQVIEESSNKQDTLNSKPKEKSSSTQKLFQINNKEEHQISHDSVENNNEQIKCNFFIQKRNRMDDTKVENINKLEIDVEAANKNDDLYDSSCDMGLRSPHHLKKNTYHQNNQEGPMVKKMSIDLDDDTTNVNMVNKKYLGCNCKNSGCLKRYCECFSRMKYCDSNCQCKNCFNNVKYEKERNDAIKNYLIKSPVSFKKINLDLNNVTCYCKKSNCLKNYCECFQLGMKCSYNCGCVDCKNRNLFEKKLFYVESNYNNKNNDNPDNQIKNQSNSQSKNDQNNNNINELIDEENKKCINNNSNTVINNANNNNNIEENNINFNVCHSLDNTNTGYGGIGNLNKINNIQSNKNNSSINFIVDKGMSTNMNNNLSNIEVGKKPNNRNRYLSFDNDMSHWNSLNLKKIEISNNKLIIDNYNINNKNENNNYQDNNNDVQRYYNNINNIINVNNNRININRKNSAFSAIIP